MKKILLLLTSSILMLDSLCGAENLLVNGDFEKWTLLEGNPPTGQPANWGLGQSSSKPVRMPGFARSSDYAAWMKPGDKNAIARGAQSNLMSCELEFYFVAEDPGTTTARSLNLSINEKGSQLPTINLRLVQGSSSGKLTLQAFDGRIWQNLAEDAFQASVYNAEKNTLTTANVHRLQIKISFEGSGSYHISYGPENGELTRLNEAHYFQTPVTGGGLSGFSFISAMSQAGFGIDNVSLK